MLSVDTVLNFIEAIIGMPHVALDAALAELQTSITDDPLTPSFQGQLALFLGRTIAMDELNPQPLPPGPPQ